LLVGGVMAFIARRHASLRERSDLAIRQHRKLKDLHDQIMVEMAEGVIVLSQNLHVSDMNPAARVLLGKKTVAELLSIPALDAFFHQSELSNFQCEFCDPTVTSDQAKEASAPALLLAVRRLSADEDAAWLMTLVDISEIRALQQQLLQQEKMAMLGKMAAMLAHEIRNPIQTMAQGLEIMALKPDSNVAMQEILSEETARLNRLVSIMLDYAKPLMPAVSLTYMPELFRQAVVRMGSACQQQINCCCQLDELLIDGDHFRLVLDNLLINALANRCPDSMVDVVLRGDDGDWLLAVSNDGDLADDMRDTLFEPFVSGRSSGLGLGLATVKQVCQANHWSVRVDVDAGKVCFRVRGSMQVDIQSSAEYETGVGVMHG